MNTRPPLFDIQPDIKEARRFLKAVIGSSDQTCFQTFKSRPDFIIEPKWRFGSLTECEDWLTKDNRRGAGVYFVVNYCDGAGRSASNVTRVRALFVDLDGSPVDPVLNCALKPNVILESSPGRYQAFWRTKNVSLGEFTPLQKALIKKFDADPSCKDLGRVMRLAGFWHLKREPFMSRIHYYNLGFPCERDMLIDRLGLEVSWTDERPGFVEESNQKDTPIVPQGKRHEQMKNLSVSLRKMGLTGQRLHDAVMKENVVRCSPPLPESEIAKMTSWANQRVKTATQRADPLLFNEAITEEIERRNEMITWDELRNMKLPPVKWVIKDLLPEGLTVLAGAPKTGKSWFAQGLSLAVACGGKALGCFPANQGQVLHLALEDTPQRFQERLIKLGKDVSAIGLRNAIFARSWKPLPDALQSMQDWIKANENPRLIVIDTFQKIRPKSNAKFEDNAYSRDYVEVGMLHQLAIRNSVAILLIHHKRKAVSEDPFNGISGSSGITGAADAIMIFDKPDREKMAASILISGRDVSDRKYHLRWADSPGETGWLYDPEDVDQDSRDSETLVKQAIIHIGRPCSVSDICGTTGLSQSHVYRLIENLKNSGAIQRAVGMTGRYILSDGQCQLLDGMETSLSRFSESWDGM